MANDPEQRFRATCGLRLIRSREPDLELATKRSEELLAAVEHESDTGLVLQAHHAAWTTDWRRGQPNRARRHTEIGPRVYEAAKHHQNIERNARPGSRQTYHLLVAVVGYGN